MLTVFNVKKAALNEAELLGITSSYSLRQVNYLYSVELFYKQSAICLLSRGWLVHLFFGGNHAP